MCLPLFTFFWGRYCPNIIQSSTIFNYSIRVQLFGLETMILCHKHVFLSRIWKFIHKNTRDYENSWLKLKSQLQVNYNEIHLEIPVSFVDIFRFLQSGGLKYFHLQLYWLNQRKDNNSYLCCLLPLFMITLQLYHVYFYAISPSISMYFDWSFLGRCTDKTTMLYKLHSDSCSLVVTHH